jgi:hypothetical protein
MGDDDGNDDEDVEDGDEDLAVIDAPQGSIDAAGQGGAGCLAGASDGSAAQKCPPPSLLRGCWHFLAPLLKIELILLLAMILEMVW